MTHRLVSDRQRGGVFRLSTVRDRNTLKIRVRGSLDTRTGHHLEDALCQLSRSGDSVLLDLCSVRVLEGDGLDAVVRTHRQLNEKGVVLKVRTQAGPIEASLSERGVTTEVTTS